MERHPHHAFWRHTGAELSAAAGVPLVERRTLHQWNLSAVEQVRFADGRLAVYKAQWGPTREVAFYRAARSPLLCAAQVLPVTAVPTDRAYPGLPPERAHPGLLLEHLAAPTLLDAELARDEALAVCDELGEALRQVEGVHRGLAYVDLGGADAWRACVARALDRARQLLGPAASRRSLAEALVYLERWAEQPGVLAAVEGDVGLVHGDLYGANVLAEPHGWRVIDWQRPLWGPRALDAVLLLWSLGQSPTDRADAATIALAHFLSAAWQWEVTQGWIPGLGDPVAILTTCVDRIRRSMAS